MEIVLLRHGKPKNSGWKVVSAEEFGSRIKAYDNAGIDGSSIPPDTATQVASACKTIVCSDLRRSVESAALLARTSHQLPAVTAEMAPPASLRSISLLDVSQRIRLRCLQLQA